jgi:hypothetical protein
MKKISNLVWSPAWTSVLGCIHGALEFLQAAPEISWLFGGTGHAFIINMFHDGSCPSGPTGWVTNRFFDLGKNVGYELDLVWGDKRQPDFEDKQKAAWDLTRTSLDNDLPVIGWEMAVPEFYVVNGYDVSGYYFSGPGSEEAHSPKPWQELGTTEIGMLEVFSITPTQEADPETIIKEALAFALAFNQGDPQWVLPEYRAGQAAYHVWIDAVSSGRASAMGHAYNAAVWEECRRNGVAFLRTAKKKLKGTLDADFDLAIQAYKEVAEELKEITELYPFFENNQPVPVGDNPRSKKASEHLRAAMSAEDAGQGYLTEIYQKLS